jgi:hypothetical protein
MDDERWFREEMADRKSRFDGGDYAAFMEALLMCTESKRPLEEWIAQIVVEHAEYVFAHRSTARGRHGNWRKIQQQVEIDRQRGLLAKWHMDARRKKGRGYVSELGRLYGYGKPLEDGTNVVTPDDVFEHVSRTLRGKPARGSKEQVEDSYQRIIRGRPKRKRKTVKRKQTKRGGK